MQRNLRFQGVGRLYTNSKDYTPEKGEPHIDIVDKLTSSTVVVIGLGGVGSWAAEALCRSGVGSLVLVDLDDVCISNTNRQLHATSSGVGQMKIDVMQRRLHDINPACNVTLIHDFISQDNIGDILDSVPDITACLDAIDGAKSKVGLIAACVEKKIPLVMSGGSAGRTDPTQVKVEDITVIMGDRLLGACRKELRKYHGFADGLTFHERQYKKMKMPRKWNVPSVYSAELPKVLPKSSNGGSSLRRCDGDLGTACFVTGTFGFVAAGKIVDMIVKDELLIPRKS